MAKKEYKKLNYLKKLKTPDDRAREILFIYQVPLHIFWGIFISIYPLSINKESKIYSPEIVVSLYILQILVEYWNILREEEKQITQLSDKDLLLIRGAANSRGQFKQIAKKDKILTNVPQDFFHIINNEPGSKGDNFKKYITYDKNMILSAIANLCLAIDNESLDVFVSTFLKESIKNLVNALNINKYYFPKDISFGYHKTSFDIIFFDIKLGKKSYHKTRQRFQQEHLNKLKGKIPAGV